VTSRQIKARPTATTLARLDRFLSDRPLLHVSSSAAAAAPAGGPPPSPMRSPRRLRCCGFPAGVLRLDHDGDVQDPYERSRMTSLPTHRPVHEALAARQGSAWSNDHRTYPPTGSAGWSFCPVRVRGLSAIAAIPPPAPPPPPPHGHAGNGPAPTRSRGSGRWAGGGDATD